jgi:hypothetical protein
MSAKLKFDDAAPDLVELHDKLDAVLAGQTEILDELRLLGLAIERRGKRYGDDAAIAKLLGAIVDAGAEPFFTAVELAELAALTKTECMVLRDAIIEAVREVNPRKIGHLLRRIEGRDFGGRAVHRIKTERDGLLWQIVASLRV